MFISPRLNSYRRDGLAINQSDYRNPPSASGRAGARRTGKHTRRNVMSNYVYRAYRYAPDYSGLQFLDLTPGKPIELYRTP